MNLKLKLKIIEKFGGQWRFASIVNEHESTVSKVVRNQKILADEKKLLWAKALGCGVEEVFDGETNS